MTTIKTHPLSWLTIAILILATLFEHYWIWGGLFVWWALTSWRSGEAFVVETIRVRDNAALFYVLVLMWGGFGVLYMVQDLAWKLFGLYMPI